MGVGVGAGQTFTKLGNCPHPPPKGGGMQSRGRAVRQRECAGKGHVHRSQRPPSGGPHPSPGGVGGVRKRQVVQTTSPFSKFSSSIIAEWAKCKKTTQSLRRATGAHDTHPVWGLSARAPDGMIKTGRGHPTRLGLWCAGIRWHGRNGPRAPVPFGGLVRVHPMAW